MKMWKCLFMAALTFCSVWSVCGQKVEEGRGIAGSMPPDVAPSQIKGREEIQRFMAGLMLEQMVVKWSKLDLTNDEEAMKCDLASFPGKLLDRCPEDFKTVWQEVLSTCREKRVPLKKLPVEELKKLEIRMKLLMKKYHLQRFSVSGTLLNFVLLTLNPEQMANPDRKDWSRRAKALRRRLETGQPQLPSVEKMMEWSWTWEKRWKKENGWYEEGEEPEGEEPDLDGDDRCHTLIWYVFGWCGEEKEDDCFF